MNCESVKQLIHIGTLAAYRKVSTPGTDAAPDTIGTIMSFIYLNKLELNEKVRIDPNEFRMIEPLEVSGSIVTFRDGEFMRYRETPKEIEHKEWRVRYLWPNIEKVIVATIGGVIGSLLTMLAHSL
jgi:hypothetical protein